MDYGFYPVLWLFFIYSFAGWLLETAQAAVKQKRFVNRGFLNMPLCPIYGTVSLVFAMFLPDLYDRPLFLFLGGMILSAFVEFVSGWMLEKIFHRKWWDYSDEKFQFEGYVCLKYAAVWGVFAVLCIRFLNPLVFRLGSFVPTWISIPLLWVLTVLLVIDFASSAAALLQMKQRLRRVDEIGDSLGQITDALGNVVTRRIQRRVLHAYPNLEVEKIIEAKKEHATQEKPTVFAAGCSFYKLVWLFVIGCVLGDFTETIFCRVTAGVWMSRSSLVYGPFSIVWGLGCVMFTALLYRWRDKSDRFVFIAGTVLGGAYEYVCSVFTEIVFGTVFWDYSKIPFNLGGRINLLYCFFWGIAAVVWLKGCYPVLSRWIEKLPMRTGKILTWVLIVFMVFNMIMSALAMARYNERRTQPEPTTAIAVWLDEHFPDERMERTSRTPSAVNK